MTIRAIVTGSTGMVGEGVMMECLDNPAVEKVLVLNRKPGGVSHQHFNADPKKPARWLALITNTYRPHLGYEIVQIEDSPDWKGSWEKSVKL